MHRVAVTAIAVACAVVVTACQQETQSSGALRLAVTDLQGLEELQREFGAFVEEFERATGFPVEFYAVADRAAAAAALNADQVDLVFTGPAEYVVMRARTDAVPVIAIRRPDYHSCIYTRTDSGVNSVAALTDKKVGMSDIGSTSGHLGPSQLLVDAGLKPGVDVEVLTLGDAVHEALKRGDIDAVGVGCHDYDEYMAADQAEAYTVLVEGPPLPPDIILAHKDVDPATIAAIRSGFEANWDALLTAMLEGKDNQKYQNATLVLPSDGDYDPVRSMYQAVGVNDFTAFVGN
jgi:phosphonate transport system substrate-binding protein